MIDPRSREEPPFGQHSQPGDPTIVPCPSCTNQISASKTARKKYGLSPRLIEMEDAESVQDSPCAFGTFCIVYNGEVISHHPISNGRFENIMDKMKK